MKTPEQEANELVEMLLQTIWDTGNTVSKPMVIDVAILHVERLIEVLGELLKNYLIGKLYHYHQHYQQVLQILKDKK